MTAAFQNEHICQSVTDVFELFTLLTDGQKYSEDTKPHICTEAQCLHPFLEAVVNHTHRRASTLAHMQTADFKD